jgi:hypothetical protein
MHHLRSVRDPFARWQGRILTFAFAGDVPEQEICAMLLSDIGRDGVAPDQVTPDGVPLYRAPDDALFRIQRDFSRRCCDARETTNLACNAGRAVLLNFVANAGGLAGVQYFAVGTGSGTPTSGDTQLFTEVFRKAPTTTLITGNSLLITTAFQASEGNFTYTEAGLFGNGATSTANSGTLFAHATYAYAKTSQVTLTNIYTISFN